MKQPAGFALRRAVPGDEEALALIGSATFLETYCAAIAGPDMLAHCRHHHAASQYAAWLADGHYRLCLAEILGPPSGAPVGFAVLSPPDLPGEVREDDVELKRIYLLHRLQGRGLGRALVDWSVAEARLMHKRRLVLGVKEDNVDAIAFYERMGFARYGTRRFLVGSTVYDDYLLELAL